MTERKVAKMVRGQRAIDGAGVHLVRVLGRGTSEDFDPFLMLDSFDSTNPDDYTAGFPFHPHRGIETITYLVEGEIEHQDSLGNRGSIKAGQSQWMTAGSGILHQEMPQQSPRMLGVQLWLNLPRKEKMTSPRYLDIGHEMIGKKETDTGIIRVLSGEYEGVKGVDPYHIQASIYDVTVDAGKSITLFTKPEDNVFVFLPAGDAALVGSVVDAITAVLFGDGDPAPVSAQENEVARCFMFGG